MVREPQVSPVQDLYKYSSITRETSVDETEPAIWFVAFNQCPSKYHLRGSADWWKRRADKLNPKDRGIFQGVDTSGPVSVEKATFHNTVFPHDNEYGDSDSEDCSTSELTTSTWQHMFATVSGHGVKVYLAWHGKDPELVSSYVDQDKDEVFYAVEFVYNANNDLRWWVLAAGQKGIVRVLQADGSGVVKTLVGHGEAINHIAVHPRDPAIIATASKDESLRLWNLRLGSSVAMFAGLKGHRGEVLFVDFDRFGNRFASCGIDNSIRVWDLIGDDAIVKSILESHQAADCGDDKYMFRTEDGEKKVLRVPAIQFPWFVSRKIHKHYVDCVKWVGKHLLMSKSVHNRVYLWELGTGWESLAQPASDFKLLEEYPVDKCNVWFIRFGLDRKHTKMVCGNEKGHAYLYEIGNQPTRKTILKEPNGSSSRSDNRTVRMCAFSDDGSMIITVDDSANIVQYDRQERTENESENVAPPESEESDDSESSEEPLEEASEGVIHIRD